MIVYLSCDSQNEFFVKVVKESIDEINKSTDNLLELIYPPKKIGRDTGTVRGNILQIQQAELVIFDVTPRPAKDIYGKDIELYNSGVMIEFGIVVDLENHISGVPWGKAVKPTYKVFRHSKFPKSNMTSNMTPIINESSISSYTDGEQGEKVLRSEILQLLKDKLKEKANFNVTYGSIPTTEAKFNQRAFTPTA